MKSKQSNHSTSLIREANAHTKNKNYSFPMQSSTLRVVTDYRDLIRKKKIRILRGMIMKAFPFPSSSAHFG